MESCQLEADLTLEKAMIMAHQTESVRKQQSFIRGDKEILIKCIQNL